MLGLKRMAGDQALLLHGLDLPRAGGRSAGFCSAIKTLFRVYLWLITEFIIIRLYLIASLQSRII